MTQTGWQTRGRCCKHTNRWQSNLGPSPQAWATCPLRQVRGWAGMGDIMADGLEEGFFGAYVC